jgi:hypothetical protein
MTVKVERNGEKREKRFLLPTQEMGVETPRHTLQEACE